MGLVGGDRLGGNLVEGLDVDQAADQAFLVEFHHVGGDAAKGEGSLDAFLQHALAYVLDYRQGSSARTGLDAEAILEVTGVDDDLRSLFRKQYVTRVLGVADSP